MREEIYTCLGEKPSGKKCPRLELFTDERSVCYLEENLIVLAGLEEVETIVWIRSIVGISD